MVYQGSHALKFVADAIGLPIDQVTFPYPTTKTFIKLYLYACIVQFHSSTTRSFNKRLYIPALHEAMSQEHTQEASSGHSMGHTLGTLLLWASNVASFLPGLRLLSNAHVRSEKIRSFVRGLKNCI